MPQAAIIIAGLGDMESSPIVPLVAPLGGKLYSWETIEKDPDGFVQEFEAQDDLVDILGHSLGGYCSVLVASLMISKWKKIRLTLLEPVTGTVNQPWAQFGAPPIQVSPNVVSAWAYLREGYAFQPWTWACCPPYHQPLMFDDGKNFKNIKVPQSDHNSIVGIVQDEVISRVKGPLV